MRTLRLIVMSILLTGCGLCSTHVYVGTVKLSTDNQVCLSISPDDFNKNSRFRVVSWRVYYYDKNHHSVMVSEKIPQETTDAISAQHDIIVSPGECIAIKSDIPPGDYEFHFSTGEENDLINTLGDEVWRGSFTLSQDANGQFHLTDKKGAR
ncbi:hypothetical protein [Salmonella enterica]|uniref:hypothetical protein n=1 Tax=Salmonella enterica TaxID=28901 RepID=UPI0021D4E658|nr:hypothetical protein [Salmonella enterica]MCU7082918.1 hypothetical protein [Salmonella enterica]MCU7143060.1 hypothetical protein [Salmonella enterica]